MNKYDSEKKLEELEKLCLTKYKALSFYSAHQSLLLPKPTINVIKTNQPLVTSSFMASSASILPCLKSLREVVMVTHTVVQGSVDILDENEKLVTIIKTCLNLLVTKNMKHLKNVPYVNILPHVLMSLHFVRLGGLLMKSNLFTEDVVKQNGEQLVKIAGLFGVFINIVSHMLADSVTTFTDTVKKIKVKRFKNTSIKDVDKFIHSLPDVIKARILKYMEEYYEFTKYNIQRLEHLFLVVVPKIMHI